jgi:hypothetical protein
MYVYAFACKTRMLYDLDACSYTSKCVANKSKEICIQSNRLFISMAQIFGLILIHIGTAWLQKSNLHESAIDMKNVITN